MFAIIDCNNFYASCERLFRPDLIGQPIIVLSNNDGCVIARSNEAKALNIKMGQPYFQIKKICNNHGIQVFSSNYSLYGDISARVMQTIEETWPYLEIYSIDEAFLNLHTLAQTKQLDFCQNLRHKILQNVGIPTSIGIAATKTLAKAANFIAKKNPKIGVFLLEPDQPWLELMPVEEVWGVGRRLAAQLQSLGIRSAADLARQSPHRIRQRFSLPLMQTTLELQGTACHQLTLITPKQSIIASKSFGKSQTELKNISQAISHHCARATEKLRQQGGKVALMSVFIRTNPFQNNQPQYAKRCQIYFHQASDDLREITAKAIQGLNTIFKPEFAYHKAGVCFEQIHYHQQMGLVQEPKRRNTDEFMQVFESIRNKYGRNSIHLAAEGIQQTWSMKSEQRSPAYTTCWQDLPLVKI
jgi:DNA polymerase V